MKTWAVGLMSNEEKRNILDQHKYLYDGYRTMQPEIKKEQPLFVQDFANDKGGVTLSNKNNVTTYKNVGINEQEEMEGECMECGDKGYMEEEKQVCSECGGQMMEGECMECGSKGYMEEETQQVEDLKNVEDLNLSDKFDYVEGEVEETEQGNPYDKMDMGYDFVPKGPDVSGDVYTDNADDMDLDDEEVDPAYDFESEGPMKVYETMESAWHDLGGESIFKHQQNKMKRKMDAEDSGEEFDDSELEVSDYDDELDLPNSSWEEITQVTGDDEFANLSEVDEDLRESVIVQKNKIMEMMNRMKRF